MHYSIDWRAWRTPGVKEVPAHGNIQVQITEHQVDSPAFRTMAMVAADKHLRNTQPAYATGFNTVRDIRPMTPLEAGLSIEA